jgi:hypothetical protein
MRLIRGNWIIVPVQDVYFVRGERRIKGTAIATCGKKRIVKFHNDVAVAVRAVEQEIDKRFAVPLGDNRYGRNV